MKKVYDSPLPVDQWMLAEIVNLLSDQAIQRTGWTLEEAHVSPAGVNADVKLVFRGTEMPEAGEPGGLRPVQVAAMVEVRTVYVTGRPRKVPDR